MSGKLHPGISRGEYERIPALNFSTLKHYAKTPMHARYLSMHPPVPTAAMEFGTAVHLAVLEPDRFLAECAVAPKVDRRTKEGKLAWAAFEAENAGNVLLTGEDYGRCEAIRDAVWEHPIARQLLSGQGHTEVAVVWEHLEPKLVCKGLIDRMGSACGFSWVVDLKSCRDASPVAFSTQIARQYYHAQAAMYIDGCDAISPYPRRFAWIAAETEPPHAVAVYEPTADVLEVGRLKVQEWLAAYDSAQSSGVWPGYGTEVYPIGLPKWAMGSMWGEEW